jgi:adenosylhomocysteinase
VPDARALRAIIDRDYSPRDHPALIWQADLWRSTKPLDGVPVVDATPLFANTLAKYVPLLAAGADLTVHVSPLLPHDPYAVSLLQEVGIPVTRTAPTCDIALDCAGSLAHTRARVGYVELTKSGQHMSTSRVNAPVFLADNSRIKLIETVLGTGDGFIRGLSHFGHGRSRGEVRGDLRLRQGRPGCGAERT